MKDYKIIVIGASGSGKTVFLASLFKKLSMQGNLGFSLSVENTDEKKVLNKIYEELSKGNSWPLGTRNIREWKFNCCVKDSKLSPIQACTFTYIDYAGGLITDLSEPDDDNQFDSDYSQFESSIESADAVLVLIDGQKLLSLMKNKESSSHEISKFIQGDMRNIMQLVDKCTKHTPVNFIISKWDLLENNYPLEQVKNHLLEKVTEFRDVVGNRKKAGCPVRLIPISSVGQDFAILENGQMKRIPGKIPQPQNLESTLAFALTDNEYNRVDDLKSSPNSKKKFFKRNIVIYCLLAFLTLILPRLGLIISIAYFLIRWLMKKNQNSTKKDTQTTNNQEIISYKDAFAQVLNASKSIEQQFLAKFPESNL